MKKTFVSIALLVTLVFSLSAAALDAEPNPGTDDERFTVTFSTASGETISARADGKPIPSGASVEKGASVTFTVSTPRGYRIKEWRVNGAVVSGETSDTYTLPQLAINTVVAVSYEPIPKPVVTYRVFGKGGYVHAFINGSQVLMNGSSVDNGQSVKFVAHPDAGYRLKGWTLNGSPVPGEMSSAYTLASVTDSVTVEVVFEVIPKPVTHTVLCGTSGNGSIWLRVDGKLISSGAAIEAGKNVICSVTPLSGWTFKQWEVNGSAVSTAADYVHKDLSEDIIVRAVFTQGSAADGENTDENGLNAGGEDAAISENDVQTEEGAGTNAVSPRSTTLETTGFTHRFPRWAWRVGTFLAHNDDNTLTYVDGLGDAVRIETTDPNGKILSAKTVAFELPIFGTFVSGEDYHYIAFGQNNKEQSSGMEMIRIVKYDKNFNKLASAVINGGAIRSTLPFNATGARMAEHDGKLILYTGRERYRSSDGKNHQSNLAVVVDTKTMKVLHTSADFPAYHVSHSFDQFVLFDGNRPVLADHGDSYPRSVVLQRARSADVSGAFDKATMFKIPGPGGANCTGVTVGGFGMSEQNYLAVITTIDHSKAKGYTSFEIKGLDLDQRDIVVCVLPKSFQNGATASKITVGKYVGTDKIASTPKMLSNGDGTFVLFWQEFSTTGTKGDYVTQTIGSDGKASGTPNRYSKLADIYKAFLHVGHLPGNIEAIDEPPKSAQATETLEAPEVDLSHASDWAAEGITQAMEKGFMPLSLQGRYTDVITRAEFCRMAVSWVEYATGKNIDTVLTEKGLRRSPDVFSDTHDSDILAAYALGITNGTGGGKFSPNGKFTREQAATMIQNMCRAIGADVNNPPNAGFSDMESMSSWAIGGINYCRAKGIMQGTGNNNFSPKTDYTIEQSIVTLNNINIDQLFR